MQSAALVLVAALLAVVCVSAHGQDIQAGGASAQPANIISAEEQQQRAESMAATRKLLGYRPIPIDASVVLLFMSDVDGGENSPCVQMVKRALEFKGRAIK